MVQELNINGFLEDYPDLIDSDHRNPSPDALINVVLITTRAGETQRTILHMGKQLRKR